MLARPYEINWDLWEQGRVRRVEELTALGQKTLEALPPTFMSIFEKKGAYSGLHYSPYYLHPFFDFARETLPEQFREIFEASCSLMISTTLLLPIDKGALKTIDSYRVRKEKSGYREPPSSIVSKIFEKESPARDATQKIADRFLMSEIGLGAYPIRKRAHEDVIFTRGVLFSLIEGIEFEIAFSVGRDQNVVVELYDSMNVDGIAAGNFGPLTLFGFDFRKFYSKSSEDLEDYVRRCCDCLRAFSKDVIKAANE